MADPFEICNALNGTCRWAQVQRPACVSMVAIAEDGQDADDERARIKAECDDAASEREH